METHNNKSISIGASVTNTLRCKKDAITRLKKYVGTHEKHQNKNDIDGANDTAQQFDWTPCRYNVLGWKYQERGTFQKHLNQPFKINTVGGFGPNQSID